MTFRIVGLDPGPFREFFSMSESELTAKGARIRVADEEPGYPCRVSLEDARVGEELVLLPFEYHATTSPYRASGPIYVRRNAERAFSAKDRVPDALLRRLLSVRAYDESGMMLEAEVCPGTDLAAIIGAFFDDQRVRYLHVHNAKPGCFACKVERS